MLIKINGIEYLCDKMVTHINDYAWDMRDNIELFMHMTHDEACAVFINGVNWSYALDESVEVDCTKYSVAGAITDYRDGTISVRMGRPTISEEESARILPYIQKAIPSLNDEDALEVKDYFEEWGTGIAYVSGDRFKYIGRLYKVLQDHISSVAWKPDTSHSLYAEIVRAGTGTRENPVIYNNNMELIEGLYYTQNDVLYICTRSTGSPVYNDLSDLVGIYVEITE